MFDRRSLSLPIFPYDPNLERISRRSRSKWNSRLRAHSKSPMAEEPKPVLLRDHYVPSTYTPTSSFQLLDITTAHFEIKSGFIQMLPLFYGLNTEDPYKHLDEFIEICSTIRLQNFTEDALRTSLETNSITSWAQMQHEFLKKYFTIGKTNHIQKAITGFSQIEGEPFHETWERMKDLL